VSGSTQESSPELLADNTVLTAQDEAADNLIALVETLHKIDTDSATAKLNEVSMSDNNGGRIAF
jgi:hypothetical protein